MKGSRLRQLKAVTIKTARGIWRRRDFILRVAIAWLIGFCFFLFDRQDEIDMRLQLRGPQATSKEIVLLQVSPEEWLKLKGSSVEFPRFSRHPKLPDGFFWNTYLWNQLSDKLLAAEPKAVMISLNFSSQRIRSRENFRDPRMHWLSRKVVVGETDLDRVFRRVNPTFENKTHLSRVASKIFKEKKLAELKDIQLINYRGPRGTFPSFTFADILDGKIPTSIFRDKLVIIGANAVSDHEFMTPLGSMSRAEIYANTIDNQLENRWANATSAIPFAIILLFLAAFTAWITTQYPQFLTVVILAFFQIGILAVSLSTFDFPHL